MNAMAKLTGEKYAGHHAGGGRNLVNPLRITAVLFIIQFQDFSGALHTITGWRQLATLVLAIITGWETY
jgi:hypothetical protein